MTQDDDRLLQALARLPQIEPDVRWEAHVQARCHAAISRRASRRTRARRSLFGMSLVDLGAAGALCVYLAAVLAEAARLLG
jgi:hypothetical protein